MSVSRFPLLLMSIYKHLKITFQIHNATILQGRMIKILTQGYLEEWQGINTSGRFRGGHQTRQDLGSL